MATNKFYQPVTVSTITMSVTDHDVKALMISLAYYYYYNLSDTYPTSVAIFGMLLWSQCLPKQDDCYPQLLQ